jgi:hypothetical protein
MISYAIVGYTNGSPSPITMYNDTNILFPIYGYLSVPNSLLQITIWSSFSDERFNTTGVVKNDVLLNGVESVILNGSIANIYTGLSVGWLYYIDNNAAITTTQTPKQIGIAVWSTSLLLQQTQIPNTIIGDGSVEHYIVTLSTDFTISLTTTTYVNIPNTTFTINTAGSWEIIFNLFYWTTPASTVNFRLTDLANNIVPNSQIRFSTFVSGTLTPLNTTSKVTVNNATTYKLMVSCEAQTSFVMYSTSSLGWKIICKKISGFLQNSGTMIDYIYLKLGGNDVITTNNSDLFFQWYQSGNIWYTQTTFTSFTLLAGKTYDLCAYIRTTTATVNDYIEINWVNWLNVPLIETTPAYITGNGYAKAAGIIVISGDTVVKLRVTTNVGDVTIKNTWWVQIKQVGWTNLLVWTMNMAPTVSEYATPGTYSWTKPYGCRYIEVEVIGGGGSSNILSGFNMDTTNFRLLGAGGNGGYFKGMIISWSLSQTEPVIVTVGNTTTSVIWSGAFSLGSQGWTSWFGWYVICNGGARGDSGSAALETWIRSIAYANLGGTVTKAWNVTSYISDSSWIFNDCLFLLGVTTLVSIKNPSKNPYINANTLS